jgi:hypothetical protein
MVSLVERATKRLNAMLGTTVVQPGRIAEPSCTVFQDIIALLAWREWRLILQHGGLAPRSGGLCSV